MGNFGRGEACGLKKTFVLSVGADVVSVSPVKSDFSKEPRLFVTMYFVIRSSLLKYEP